jgi:hypothetical protein
MGVPCKIEHEVRSVYIVLPRRNAATKEVRTQLLLSKENLEKYFDVPLNSAANALVLFFVLA